jgi:hypothetical protein
MELLAGKLQWVQEFEGEDEEAGLAHPAYHKE